MSGPKSSSFFGSNESSNGCVMVVEEDPTIRNSVRKMLEKGGYDVLEVEGGEKAIETIGQGENPLVIDVIITDIDKAPVKCPYIEHCHKIKRGKLTGAFPQITYNVTQDYCLAGLGFFPVVPVQLSSEIVDVGCFSVESPHCVRHPPEFSFISFDKF